MQMTGEKLIPEPRSIVWKALNDPAILRECVPGCQSLEKISDTEMVASAPTFAVLLVIMMVSGERPSVTWLAFPVALLLVGGMSLGIGLFLARLVHDSRDAANFIPMLIRLLRYVSGVFYAVDHYAQRAGAPGWLVDVMTYQPVAVMMNLVRQSLMREAPLDSTTWLVGLAWAVVLPVIGLLYFWRGEGTYGRG